MTVSERTTGDVTILSLQGDLTTGEAAQRLREKILDLLQQGRTSIVVDLGGVVYVDSAGLSELAHAAMSARTQGGGVKLLHVGRRLSELLVTTKLTTVFETFGDEETAVASFGSRA